MKYSARYDPIGWTGPDPAVDRTVVMSHSTAYDGIRSFAVWAGTRRPDVQHRTPATDDDVGGDGRTRRAGTPTFAELPLALITDQPLSAAVKREIAMDIHRYTRRAWVAEGLSRQLTRRDPGTDTARRRALSRGRKG